jgi:hypothetical protein
MLSKLGIQLFSKKKLGIQLTNDFSFLALPNRALIQKQYHKPLPFLFQQCPALTDDFYILKLQALRSGQAVHHLLVTVTPPAPAIVPLPGIS